MAKGDFDQFFDKVLQTVDRNTGDTVSMSDWMIKYMRHPQLVEEPWSFKHHEYQIDIVNCTSENTSIEKCSQIGASELIARLALALTTRMTRYTTIYMFPVVSQLNHFVSHRINTIIDDSPLLRSSVNPELNNTSLKQVGDSFLYFIGSQKPAISIPAMLVISDETNFSNLANVQTAFSRLGHNSKDDPGRFIEFSTPTIPDYGVSQGYNQSSRGHYMVKCYKCAKTNPIDFFDDLIIPGYDEDIHDFRRQDLEQEHYLTKDAHFLCPSCRRPLSPENMIDADARQWVHEFPDKYKAKAGFHIEPQDVYYINPPSRTLSQLSEYKASYADWKNFKVGQPHLDAEAALAYPTRVKPRPTNPMAQRFLGIDVGKTSWFVVIEMDRNGRITVLELRSIRLAWDADTGNTTTFNLAQELKRKYAVRDFMVDSMPDLSLSTSLVSSSYVGSMSEYVNKPINHDGAKEIIFNKGDVTKVFRTGAFNELAKRLARTTVDIFYDIPDADLLDEHLSNMKKVVKDGVETWLKLGEDHYCHALNYAICASGRVHASKYTDESDIVLPQTVLAADIGGASRGARSGFLY